MDKLMLTKLLYIVERKSLELRGFPMIYDTPVCMPHGPVLSATLNITNYEEPSDEWRACVRKPTAAHAVRLVDGVQRDHLRRLSRRDRKIIQAVWDEFGHMGTFELRNYTHNLPEYEDPRGSSRTLPYKDILRAVGYNNSVANELAEDIEYYRQVP